ncbi:MAG: substrate-binding domain-containing protein [Trueperaceae bacterium]|nr:MAG: substrate-binding domain-containing protein [Trueperaceae bacterium]
MIKKVGAILLLALVATTLFGSVALAQIDELERQGWCEDVTIRFFAGGTEGDAFAGIVYRGALAAARDLGADVEYVFSGWDSETMTQQLREAVAQQPDGIAMMGHPGNDAILPLAAEAAESGIIMMYQNVDVDQVRARYGGGYVGAQLYSQGRALAEEAIRQFDLTPGATVLVLVNLEQIERAQREVGVIDVFKENGFNVVNVDSPPEWAADPNLGIPSMTAALLNNPDTELVGFSGGQTLGNTQTYFEAAGLEAGQVKAIGFDTNEFIMQGFADDWIHLTSDQQPFLQGYMPILSICQTAKFGLAPLNVDTGAGFIDANNFEQVKDLANAGYR